MKASVILASLAVVISSCGDNSKDSTTTTDSTVQTTQSTSTPPNTTMDTFNLSGESMMEIMNRNMNQMKAVPSTGNPDNDFAALMKIHHMGAVEMAQLELSKGSDPKVKAMAQKMLDAQQKEIAELNTFLSGHEAHGGGNAFHKEVLAKMDGMKMSMDHSGSIDKQFVEMMIPHHQGAIDMANAYIKAGAHEEKMKAMANMILVDQRKEIAEMQAWLNAQK